MKKSKDDALASEGLSFGITNPSMSKLKEEELLRLLGMAVQNAIEYFVINKDKEFMAKIPKLQQAHLQIKEMIQKPKVTEKWIKEEARRLHEKSFRIIEIDEALGIIHLLVKEIHGRK